MWRGRWRDLRLGQARHGEAKRAGAVFRRGSRRRVVGEHDGRRDALCSDAQKCQETLWKRDSQAPKLAHDLRLRK